MKISSKLSLFYVAVLAIFCLMAGALAAAIDVSGQDEIAAFGGSMKGVHAAIEELLRIVSVQNTAKS